LAEIPDVDAKENALQSDHTTDRPQPTLPTDPAPGRPWTRQDRKHLILWLVIVFAVPGLVFYVYHSVLGQPIDVLTLKSEFVLKGVAALAAFVATWVICRLEKRPLAYYGLPPRQAFGLRFWEGCVWGFAALSALLLLLGAFGYFRIDSVLLHGRTVWLYALGWGIGFFFVSVSEELVFRGYPFFLTARRIPFWRAAFALSTGFACAHLANPGETVIGILQVFTFGMVLCLTIQRTGNLWFALGFHAAWDWAETFFYGTADSGLTASGHLLESSPHGPAWLSGGSVGPEGSIFVLLVLLLCAVATHLRFPRVVWPDPPQV
jgi:uncharacterized protein